MSGKAMGGSIRTRLGRSPLVAAVGGLAVIMGAACASTGAWRPRQAYDMIGQDELSGTTFHNALELVQALHSNWLLAPQNSGMPWAREPTVYMDNVRLGGIAELQFIPLTMVQYVQHFTAVEATTRWGINHSQGVIYVSTHAQ